MGANANACPVGAGGGVGSWITILNKRRYHLIHQMWVRAAVTAPLDERAMLGIVNLGGLCKTLNRLGQQMCEVGYFDLRRNLMLGLFGRVQDMRLVLDQR